MYTLYCTLQHLQLAVHPAVWLMLLHSVDPRNADSTMYWPKERRLNTVSTHGVSFETKNTCSRLYTAPLKTFKTENTAYYIILRCLRICRIPTSSSPIQYPNVHFFTTMQEPGGEMREAASMRRRPPRHLAVEAAPLLPGSRVPWTKIVKLNKKILFLY